jgi:hypothetical protein
MAISAVKLLWLIDPHDLHGMLTSDWERRPIYGTYFLHREFQAEKTCLTIG